MSSPNPDYPQTLNPELFTKDSKEIISSYICPLCQGVLYQPIIDQCGDAFCKNCFMKFNLNNQGVVKCPLSGNVLSSQPIPVMLIQKQLEKNTKLRCSNDCGWVGNYGEYFTHLEQCENSDIKCEKCQGIFKRKTFASHSSSCPKEKIVCTNCGDWIERCKLKEHNSICRAGKNCDFFEVGCDVKCFNEAEMNNHINSNLNHHMKLMCNFIVNMKKELLQTLSNNPGPTSYAPVRGMPELTKESSVLQQNTSNLSQGTISTSKNKVSKEKIENINTSMNKSYLSRKRTSEDSQAQMEMKMKPPPQKQVQGRMNRTSFFLDPLPEGVIINGNRIKNNVQSKLHKFALCSLPISNEKPTRWKVINYNKTKWIGFGLCDKEKAKRNDYKFYNISRNFNHGLFLVSSNSYIWNCNEPSENNHHLIMPPIEENKEIFFTYDPKEKTLSFNIDTFEGKLTKVYPLLDKVLTVCIIFLHSDNEVEILPL